MGVIGPKIRCATIASGKTKNNQLSLGISIPILLNSFESSGASKYIPKKEIVRSKIAYSPIRNCLKKVMVSIYLNYIIRPFARMRDMRTEKLKA
jgi:hypothetical protein